MELLREVLQLGFGSVSTLLVLTRALWEGLPVCTL